MEFEWDLAKATQNLRKHKVTFNEATTVFGDFLSITVADPDHSISERRFITVGNSGRGRLLLVAHAQRDEIIRLISARTLTRRERKNYESTQE